jgi:hypothetical protein
LNVGWYGNSRSFGLPNDSISSLWVGANVRVSLFEHASYKGEEAFFEGGYEYGGLGNANDETSSIIVDYDRGTHAAYWYEGNDPSNRQTFWTDNAQGIAHDDDYWYITQERVLRKWHITANLSSDRDIQRVSMPAALAQRGCNHFGDPDAKNGYVFVPVTGCNNRIPLLAVFDASDLHLVCYDELYGGQGAGWVAIDPTSDYLYTSDKYLDSSHPLFVYEIDWNAIYDDPNPHWILYQTLFDQYLYRRDGGPINLAHLQGGTFSDDGKLLYLSNGYWDCSQPRDGYGLRIFNKNTRRMIAKSGNGYGPSFNFENHCGGLEGEEIEGLDYVDMNGRGGPFGGVLHAMLLDNDVTTDDDIFIKHYNK